LKSEEIIKKNYVRNFVCLLLLILLIGISLSATVLYLDIYKPLNTHYSAILTIMTEVKDTLMAKTFKINAISFLLIAAGVGILTLLYTHRIAGPLHRIKLYVKSVSEGRLDSAIKFRRKDAVNTFAESLNDMTENYRDKVSLLSSEVTHLKTSIEELKASADNRKVSDDALTKINAIDSKIKTIFQDIKL
jgi:methyl-accepting chemotaxis protein